MRATLNQTRTFGVEIECYGILDTNALVQLLRNNNFTAGAMGYSQNGRRNMEIAVKTDGSLHSPPTDFIRYGHELTFKATYTPDHLREIKRLCDLLHKVGMSVNKSTGLHVHVHVADYTIDDMKSLYNLVYKYENVIGGLVPISRLRCAFAQLRGTQQRSLVNRVRSFNQLLGVLNGSRYFGLNLQAYYKNDRKTVEFRYHSGTVDYDKIMYWVLMCLRLVDHAKNRNCNSKQKLPSTREALRNYLIAVGLKPNNRIYTDIAPEYSACRAYLVRRWHKFNLERQAILDQRRAERQARRVAREQRGQQILNEL